MEYVINYLRSLYEEYKEEKRKNTFKIATVDRKKFLTPGDTRRIQSYIEQLPQLTDPPVTEFPHLNHQDVDTRTKGHKPFFGSFFTDVHAVAITSTEQANDVVCLSLSKDKCGKSVLNPSITEKMRKSKSHSEHQLVRKNVMTKQKHLVKTVEYAVDRAHHTSFEPYTKKELNIFTYEKFKTNNSDSESDND